MVVVRLKRMGRKGFPFYRIVVMDSRVQRDGKVIEELGYYSPKVSSEDKVVKEISLDQEKYKIWIAKGASPTKSVQSLVKRLMMLS